MAFYNYDYSKIQIPENYPLFLNPMDEMQSNYIKYDSNTLGNNYPNYEMKMSLNNNIYNIQTTNITNINYPNENYIISKEKNMLKIPRDAKNIINKMPKDNLKAKQKQYNFNKIKKIEYVYNNNNNLENKKPKEKQPRDNYKKSNNEVEFKPINIKKKKINIKINLIDDNSKEKISENKFNYSKTNENYTQEFNPKKTSKKNSIKNIERVKKNNLKSINAVFKNTKNKKSPDKNNNKTTKNKSNIKLNTTERDKESIGNHFLTHKSKENSDSNFATLINKKKLRMFSSYKLIHDYDPLNSSEINNGIIDKMPSKKRSPKKIATIGLRNNNRNYSPKLTAPNERTNLIKKKNEIKKAKKKTHNNINKELQRNISYESNTFSRTKKNVNNKTNDDNPKNQDSSFRGLTTNNSNFTGKKLIEIDLYEKGESGMNYNITNNIVSKPYNRKSYDFISMNFNDTKEKKQKNKRKIKKTLSTVNPKKNKNGENNILYNHNTMRITKKKLNYSKGLNPNERNESIINQKSNLFTFMKKTRRKSSYQIYNKLSEERSNMSNKSYRGFSSVKKLEEIKKKYKFYPHKKYTKNSLKHQTKDLTSESNEFFQLMNPINSYKTEEVRNLNFTEFFPQKGFNKLDEDNVNEKHIKNDTYNIKIIENEEDKVVEENEEDLLNRKSFILDLKNVIPINENKLRETINKEKSVISNKNDKITNHKTEKSNN